MPRCPSIGQVGFFVALLIAGLAVYVPLGVPLALVVLWTLTSHTKRWLVGGPASRITKRQRIIATAGGLVVVLLTVLGAGSTNEVACSSSGAKSLVIQLAKKPATSLLETRIWLTHASSEEQARMLKSTVEQISYDLDEIRTTSKDATTSAVNCAAKLSYELPPLGGGQNLQSQVTSEPITYKVEKTDDGRLYVTAYGLRRSSGLCPRALLTLIPEVLSGRVRSRRE
jgi:hypothetical protein